MISLTVAAAEHINKALLDAGADYFRLALSQKGCSGYAYDMSVLGKVEGASLVERGAKLIDCDGIKVLIPAQDAAHLAGIALDWVRDGFSSRLSVDNPNVKNACGCGASVLF